MINENKFDINKESIEEFDLDVEDLRRIKKSAHRYDFIN